LTVGNEVLICVVFSRVIALLRPEDFEKGLAGLHDTLFFLGYERSERDPRESRALLQGGR
jgi:hypothetical protein